jgi:tRNA modification GTPase
VVIDSGRFWLGRFGENPGGPTADEVVLTVKAIVPVPWIELHCHGGVEVVRWILETLAARHVHICSWQEFERGTSDDLLQAEAAIALAQATTVRTASILLDQYHGAFSRAVALVVAALNLGEVREAARLLEELLLYVPLGRHLTTPWRVAVMGPPNVGKSSLVNALTGYQRSIVTPTPGTTRDVVTTLIAIDSWPVELIDTAGLREGADALEQQGIDRARAAAQVADLCLWLLDASGPPIKPSPALPRVHLVVNKIDLPGAWDLNEAADAAHVSARTGEGIAELCQLLSHWLVPDPPCPGAAVPFSFALAACIEKAYKCCCRDRAEQALEILRGICQRKPALAEGSVP